MKRRVPRLSAVGCAAIVVFALCLLAPGPAPAAPLVGTPFPLAATTGREFSFAAAFDGTNWLAGIQGNAINDTAVTAQLVSQSGALVGSRIDTGRTGGIPAVAFDGTNYLMSWKDDAGGLYGQFVGTGGALVGSPFEIAGAGATVNMVGGLAYGGGSYLATFYRVGGGDVRTLYGRTISPSGTLGDELTLSSDFRKDGGNVAFDGTNFLVVWTAADNASHKGRLVNPAGTLGAEFAVNASAALSDDPSAVAFDGADYLVVWMDEVGVDNNWNLYGQKVTTAGTLKGAVIAITEEAGPQFLGGLAFDGTDWLVVWTDLANDASGEGICDAGEGTCQDVYGQVLSREGTLIGPKFPIAVEAGNQFGVVAGFAGGKHLALVNLPEQLFAGLGGDVSGLFITPESIPPPIVSAPYPIAVTTAMELGLGASFDGTNFLVGIGDMSGTAPITAQLVSGGGSLVGTRIDTGGTGKPFGIAFDGTNHLVCWTESDTAYCRFVGTDGSLVGDPFGIAATVSNSGVLAYGGGSYLATYYRMLVDRTLYGRTISPAGVAGSEFVIAGSAEKDNSAAFDGTNFLVVWCDGDDDATIRGRFVSPSGIPGDEITVDPSAAPSDDPSWVAFDGTNYLVTWMDEVGGHGSGEWDIFGRLVTPAGTFPAAKFTINDAPFAQFRPIATGGGGRWLITWNDWANDADHDLQCDANEGTCWDVVGRFYDADGTPAGGPFGIGAGSLNQFGNVAAYADGKFLCLVNELGSGNFGGPTGDVYGVFVAGNGISIVATDPTATEPGPTTGTFTVSRAGDTAADLAVSYTVAGSAAKGPDYSLSPATAGVVTIPAGSASETITVTPVNDAVPEPTETVIATLGAGTGYVVGSPGSAVVRIPLNDAVPLSTALDLSRTWRTGGSAPWFGQKAVKHDGVDAARPDTLGNNQSSWLSTTVRGPARITFWWMSSSEAGDKLRFLVDTVLKATRCGTGGWQQKSFLIGSGNHEVKWEFRRNAAGGAGLDTGFVDQVRIVQQ